MEVVSSTSFFCLPITNVKITFTYYVRNRA